ncbi:MAG TPA: chalcone isomerase family protein [Gammaproteobacteria bacterium]|nr:chalcone isomerase family protein [Gammaproteobacteria bacterium]
MEGTTRIMIAVALTAALSGVAGIAAAQQTPQQTPAPATKAPPATATQKLPQTATGMPPMPQTALGHPMTRNRPMQPSSRNQPGQTGANQVMGMPEHHKAPDRTPVTIHNVHFLGDIIYDGWKLALNGVGVHTAWFFFDKFAAGLYLSTPTRVAAAAISGQGAKLIRVVTLTRMSKDDFTDMLHNAFKDTVPQDKMTPAIEQKWQQFASFFPNLNKGDKVEIASIPGHGVSVTINGNKKGEIPGKIFGRAIIGSWLGDNPVDSGLKKKLLGTSI